MSEWTHFDENGNARMVDVTGKEPTFRTAAAVGSLLVSEEVLSAIEGHAIKKGDVLTVAQVAGIMDEADVARFEAGIALKDFTTLPARLQILEVDETSASSYVEIEIAEGKFHQIKRMVAACGKEVVDLERISMGPLTLDPTLQLGEWRRLQPSELKSLEGFGVSL